MARDLQFTYGSTTIGGASANIPVDVYRVSHGYPKSTFSCEFLVSGSDYPTFASNCQALESALRTPRQRLQVTLTSGSNTYTIVDLNPATAANSGFNADASIERVSEAVENWGLVRRYRFTVTFERPGDLTGQQGRRDETVTVHTDLMKRRIVTFQGTWTAMPGNDARAQYAAQMSSHCTSTLTTIDATASWVQVSDDQPDDDADKVLRYTRIYWEVVNGRRESTVTVTKSPAGVATVTISGLYLQTLSPTTSARSNYTSNEPTHSTAVLSALGIAFYEIEYENTSDNEQDQSLSFTRRYRELIHQQSPGLQDDPQIIDDTIEIATVRYPVNDSPVPAKAGSAGKNATPAVGSNPNGTQEKPGTGSGSGTQDAGNSAQGASQVRKLVDIQVRYTAWLDKSVTDLKSKWDGTLRAYMYTLVSQKLKVSAALVDTENVQLDVPNNRIVCNLLLKGLEGTFFEFDMNVAKDEDMGVLATPALTGKPNSYLVQQGPTRIVFTKQIRAVFQSGSINVEDLMNSPPAPGTILIARTRPIYRTKQYGALGLGLGFLSLMEVQFAEVWLLIGTDVAGQRSGGKGGGGGGGSNATPGVPSVGIGGLGSGGSGGFSFSDFNGIFGIGNGLQVDIGGP